jgi:phage FluMu protein Com
MPRDLPDSYYCPVCGDLLPRALTKAKVHTNCTKCSKWASDTYHKLMLHKDAEEWIERKGGVIL